MSSSRRARRRRRHARWGKPVYRTNLWPRGMHPSAVIYDEATWVEDRLPGTWSCVRDGCLIWSCDGGSCDQADAAAVARARADAEWRASGGQDGRTVPVSFGGVGGPVVGEAVIRAIGDDAGVAFEMVIEP